MISWSVFVSGESKLERISCEYYGCVLMIGVLFVRAYCIPSLDFSSCSLP